MTSVSLSGRNRRPLFTHQLFARLIHANHGKSRVIREMIHLQHRLHSPDELGAGLWRNAPHLYQMRFQFVFFSVRRMVSGQTFSLCPSSTNFAASRRRVQRFRPFGGRPQARTGRDGPVAAKECWGGEAAIGIQTECRPEVLRCDTGVGAGNSAHRVPGTARPSAKPRRARVDEIVLPGSGARCARASRSCERPR